MGSLANRSASLDIDVFPNLGYKKDAFLEPSLVSNNFPLLTQQSNNHSCSQFYHFILDSAMSSNNMQQQQLQSTSTPPGFDPRSPRFAPRGPIGPLPVDARLLTLNYARGMRRRERGVKVQGAASCAGRRESLVVLEVRGRGWDR